MMMKRVAALAVALAMSACGSSSDAKKEEPAPKAATPEPKPRPADEPAPPHRDAGRGPHVAEVEPIDLGPVPIGPRVHGMGGDLTLLRCPFDATGGRVMVHADPGSPYVYAQDAWGSRGGVHACVRTNVPGPFAGVLVILIEGKERIAVPFRGVGVIVKKKW